ncbi:MAG: sulfurtransferase [Thermomicrobiales bacterium]|nr:sulfurtransferase [Thermomicrobiales bacterium]
MKCSAAVSRRGLLAAGMLLPTVLLPTRSGAQSTPVAASQKGFLIGAPGLIELLADDPTVRVVALTPAEDFSQAHIPGAARVDWPDLEIVETTDERLASWRAEVEATLPGLGLAPTRTVVIYDGGTRYAARLWWILEQLGHPNKLILDGGLNAWTAAGGVLKTGPSNVAPSREPYVGTPNESAVATLAEVRDAFDHTDVVLVDARSPGEYAAGHIPGAVNVEFTRNTDEAGFWLSPNELTVMYAAVGITPDKTVIPYCTTGVRSALIYFTLKMLGFPDVMLFTGSFKEWSSHPELPVTAGDRP